MKPLLEHLGHACTKLTYGGLKLVTDPFFYGAVMKTWYPWPDNRHFLADAADADFFYVSHAHEDHFDREFLRQNLDVPLIIPRFRSRHLEREVAKLGVTTVHTLGHGESMKLSKGIKVTMLLDRSHKEDSALLVEAGLYRYLDSNDCELAISDWPSDVDDLAAQFSGAFWYPHCYDFPHWQQVRKTREVRKNNLDRLNRRIRLTGARWYLPSAGPPMFLPPELGRYNNREGIFPLWEDVQEQVRDANPALGIIPPFSQEYGVADLRAYRNRRRDEWSTWYQEPDTPVSGEELRHHFATLTSMNKRWMRDYGGTIRVSVADHASWHIPLGVVSRELEEAPSPHYHMNVPMRVLRAIVDGRATWEDALSSMRVRLHRDPDVYDARLMGLLNFGDRPAQTVAMAKNEASDEMISKCGWEFQRWCPHAGEDMIFSTVENGQVTCPRHEWSWDLRTGECLTGQGVPLKTRGKVLP